MVRSRFRVGFTLVELLVVIGIIALLISILLPALTRARESANSVVCMSNMHQFGLGIQMYSDSSKGALPQKGPDGSKPSETFSDTNSNYSIAGYDDPSLWFNAIPPLVNGKSYFQMVYDAYKGTSTLPKEGIRNIFICPSANGAGTIYPQQIKNGYFLLYGTESRANPLQIFNFGGLVGLGYFPFASNYVFNSKLISSIQPNSVDSVRMSQLRPGSSVVVMVEKLNNPGEYETESVQQYFANYSGAYTSSNTGAEISAAGYLDNIGQTKADWRRFTTRHNGGGNLLFADGHVSRYSWSEVQIQPSQMIGGRYSSGLSDANQPNKMIWSVVGPVN